MGRVRSYKKIKACDPFSKRSKGGTDISHDEDPSIYEEKVKRVDKRKEKAFGGDDLRQRENELLKEAFRVQKIEKAKVKPGKDIEGKREDESMKKFKERIRNETKLTLRDELQKMTKTAIRRKEKLKERTLKKKKAKNGDVHEEEVIDMDFNQSDKGHLRPSDLGGSHLFGQAEIVGFGERVERPPDLKNLTEHLDKRKAFTQDKNEKINARKLEKEEIYATRNKKRGIEDID
eukprot:CAMPEP_0119046440 /NCGR_PEP_ID=MMETSP1177-20130426/46610_1 /TAXON_ID=2985 /ORGANISM="Ochromonas sp, Strain CCMP1899" /LENGTH=232 /DNA_ID=CAMNT_0007019593 /DNA_START=189 /DNA_END=884 /DNA_ORIENTATION=+